MSLEKMQIKINKTYLYVCTSKAIMGLPIYRAIHLSYSMIFALPQTEL